MGYHAFERWLPRSHTLDLLAFSHGHTRIGTVALAKSDPVRHLGLPGRVSHDQGLVLLKGLVLRAQLTGIIIPGLAHKVVVLVVAEAEVAATVVIGAALAVLLGHVESLHARFVHDVLGG